MRRIILILFCLVGLLSFTSQNAGDGVISALNSGDVEKMSVYFEESIYITLPGKSSSFDKPTAKNVLRDFMASKKVRQFQVIHKGGNDNSHYFIGNLNTNVGNFRTTVYLKKKTTSLSIQEIRIESN
jgi:hypothetical protein